MSMNGTTFLLPTIIPASWEAACKNEKGGDDTPRFPKKKARPDGGLEPQSLQSRVSTLWQRGRVYGCLSTPERQRWWFNH